LLSLTFDFFFNLLLLNRVESCLLFSWKPHSSGLVSYLGSPKHFLLFWVPSSPRFCLLTTKSADGISNVAKHGVLQERTHFSSYFTFYLCKWLLSLFTKLECGKHREGCKLSRPDDSGMKKAACYVCILGAHAYDGILGLDPPVPLQYNYLLKTWQAFDSVHKPWLIAILQNFFVMLVQLCIMQMIFTIFFLSSKRYVLEYRLLWLTNWFSFGVCYGCCFGVSSQYGVHLFSQHRGILFHNLAVPELVANFLAWKVQSLCWPSTLLCCLFTDHVFRMVLSAMMGFTWWFAAVCL
jgi:hypothetical protein